LRQNQITIHIKDLETREKIKELTEKLALESESEHQRYEMLRQQKVEAELELSERLKSEEVRGAAVAPAACAPGAVSAHVPRATYTVAVLHVPLTARSVCSVQCQHC
jgi:hypothetical protein